MENTRKENFRGKWELLKSGLKAGLRSLMKAKVDVIRTKHEWFDYSDMTVKRYVFPFLDGNGFALFYGKRINSRLCPSPVLFVVLHFVAV